MFKRISLRNPMHEFIFSLPITSGNEQGTYNGTIYCEFSTRLNPFTDDIQIKIEHDFIDKGLIQFDQNDTLQQSEFKKFSRSIFANLVGYTMPEDPKEIVAQVTAHVAWLFCLDNMVNAPNSQFREAPEVLVELNRHLIEVLKFSAAQTSDATLTTPINLTQYSALIKMNACMGNSLRDKDSQYVINSQQEYLNAVSAECLQRKENQWRTIEGYSELRKFTSAVNEVLEYIWALKKINLSESVRTSRHFIGVINAANAYVSYVNDVFSLDNEIKEGTQENIVRVIAHSRKLSLNNAIEQAVFMINDSLEDFKTCKSMFLKSHQNPEDFQSAIGAIKYAENLMIGNLIWSRDTGRYKQFI